MLGATSFIESLHNVPETGWTRTALSVLRAGKVAAAPGYGIERASHPGQDILYCLSGGGVVITLGQRIAVGQGQLVWIANEEQHAHIADACAPWTLLWFRFDGPDPAALRQRLFVGSMPRATVVDGTALVAWFDRLFAAMREREFGLDLRLNQLVGDFLIILNRALADPAVAGMPRALAALVAAMRSDLSRPWTAGELSALTNLSPSQTRRLFRKHLRATPRRWLLRERLIYAQALITQNIASLAEVAERCGFCDVYHFSREFKRSAGISPAAWRRCEMGATRRDWSG